MRSDDYAELNNSFRAGSARNTLRSRRGAVWGHLHYRRRTYRQWIYRQGLATQKRHDLGRAATPASLRSQGVRHCHAGILDLRPKQGGVGFKLPELPEMNQNTRNASGQSENMPNFIRKTLLFSWIPWKKYQIKPFTCSKHYKCLGSDDPITICKMHRLLESAKNTWPDPTLDLREVTRTDRIAISF